MHQLALHTLIAGHRYGVISSISAAGTPQSALVGIATTPDLDIIFDTLNTSRKYANLVARPPCSLVVGWAGQQTLQLEGTAFLPTGADLRRYQQTYFAAWPDGVTRQAWPGIVYFVVRPTWIRYSDYDQQPTLIEEFRLDRPSAFTAAPPKITGLKD